MPKYAREVEGRAWEAALKLAQLQSRRSCRGCGAHMLGGGPASIRRPAHIFDYEQLALSRFAQAGCLPFERLAGWRCAELKSAR